MHRKFNAAMLAACFAWASASVPQRLCADGGGEIVVRGTDSVIGIYRDELTDSIQEAIKKGAVWLRDNQARDGSWHPPDQWDDPDRVLGATGVILMGLLYSGVNTNSPTIERGLEFLTRHEARSNLVYTRGAILCAAAMSDPLRRNRRAGQLVERQVAWLMQAQRNNVHNLWSYRIDQAHRYDYSCVQFAVEGLRMAHSYGYQLPPAALAGARQTIVADQNADGGWGYNPKADDENPRRTKLSMTAATIGSLASLDAILAPREGRTRRDPNIDRGLKTLNDLYTGRAQYYDAYSVERAGILTGTRFIGGEDWYRQIAQRMIGRQNDDGRFARYPYRENEHTFALGTGMALLFLGKGLAPTIVGRLDWGPPSRNTAYDMHYLTESVTRDLGTHLNWINLPVESDLAEFMKVPLIYITGDEDPYPALIRHREKFIRYLNAGGTILAAGTENERAFEEGYVRFVKEIQPDSEFEDLPLDHMIYTRLHRIRRPYGLSATRSAQGGRPVALLIKNPFAMPLATQRHRNTRQATELGVNIIVSLTQLDARPNFLEDAMK